jgi:GMP synthase (glutamine-hydrolysing)
MHGSTNGDYTKSTEPNGAVLFIQNGETDEPGLFAKTMRHCGFELQTVHAWRDEPLPDTAEFSGIAIGGGAMSAYETSEYPFLESEIALIRRARALRKPVLGMCLGAQLMAAAFGGEVYRNKEREIGFYPVRFTDAAREDFLWQDCREPFQPIHWHGDTFSLPSEATLLASSAITRNQLFRLDDRLYGLQFHLEIDLPVLSGMIADDPASLSRNGIDPNILLRTAAKVFPIIEPVAQTVFTRWATFLS